MKRKQESGVEGSLQSNTQWSPYLLDSANQSSMNSPLGNMAGAYQAYAAPAQKKLTIPVPQGRSGVVLDGDYMSGPSNKKNKTTAKKTTTESKKSRISTACDDCQKKNSSGCFGWPCDHCAEEKKTCKPASIGLGCQNCLDKGIDCSGYGKPCKKCARMEKECTYQKVLDQMNGLASKPNSTHILAAVISSKPEIQTIILEELKTGKVPGTDLTNLEYLAQRDTSNQIQLTKLWNSGEIQQLVDKFSDRTPQNTSNTSLAVSNTMLSTAAQTAPAHLGALTQPNLEAAVGGVGGGAALRDDPHHDHIDHRPNFLHNAVPSNATANSYGTIADAYSGAGAVSTPPDDPMTEGYHAQYDDGLDAGLDAPFEWNMNAHMDLSGGAIADTSAINAFTKAPGEDLAGIHNDPPVGERPASPSDEQLGACLTSYLTNNGTSANATTLDNPRSAYLGAPIEDHPNGNLGDASSAPGARPSPISEFEVFYDTDLTPLTEAQVEELRAFANPRHHDVHADIDGDTSFPTDRT